MTMDVRAIRKLFSGSSGPYGTHRPSLCEAIVRTTGPILELGMGNDSTPSLHAVAEACGRVVRSFDHDAAWSERFSGLRSAHHRIAHFMSWDACPIMSEVWGVVLIDHAPAERRAVDIERLAQRAQVIVVHDSEDPSYGYDRVFGLFAHRSEDRDHRPWTMLLSNRVDVARWLVPHDPQPLKISMVVPCVKKHVARLPELVKALRVQTRRPDEVIVVVSGCARVEVPDLKARGLKISVVCNPERLAAGAARNRGSDIATGDVIVYQDADDLPHPQRVEIVAGLFELYAIDHLSHFFNRAEERRRFSLGEAVSSSLYTTSMIEGTTNGNVAVARSVLEHTRWPEHFSVGEDHEFNCAVYARTKRTAVTRLPLLTYRQQFSSFS